MPEADLSDLAELATELGAKRIASTARTIANRISEGRFYVACVGQFKRGKSTLLNALIGRAILPAGVIPVTSVPTILRFGTIPDARLRLQDSDWTAISIDDIEQYVSEEKNPENVKGIAALEIFVPCQLLASGMCLVDTPGLGSVFAGNTQATRQFIPHMDAVLVVVGADPPISGEELDLVENVAREVHELLFVLNKADRASHSDRSAAVAFAREVLEKRLHRTIPEIFEVSALQKLEGRGPDRDWPKLQQCLERLVRGSGRVLVQEARERAARRISVHLLAVIEEDRRALQQPLEETELRIAELRAAIELAGGAIRDMGALLAAEQERMSRAIAERRRIFLDQVRGPAGDDLRGRLSLLPQGRNGPGYRRETAHLAQEIARARLDPWFAVEERDTEKMFRTAMRRFVELGNDFLRRLSAMGLPRMADFPVEIDFEQGLQSKSRFHFHVIERIAAPSSPILFVADLARGLLGAREGIRREAMAFLDQLLEVNSARVQSDVDERLRESRKKLEAEIHALLREVESIAEQALDRARAAQISGSAAVHDLLERLDAAEGKIRRIDRARRGLAKNPDDLSGLESGR